MLRGEGVALDAMRIRAFPFGREVFEFIARHANGCSWWSRTGTPRCATLLVNEGDIDPSSLVPVLHYDGLPITSSFISEAIRERLSSTCEEAGASGYPGRRTEPPPPRRTEASGTRSMTHIAKPRFQHPLLGANDLGLSRRDYEGSMSTLCAGCGHDSISAAIIQACAEMSMPPHMMAKLSGIGCSSKTPNYFLSKSHGFNSVHGRMPSIATGSNLANHELYYVGVSGDGDTASIGLGQFAHAVRRQVNMLYLVENNGTYGLTKGQLSATADVGMRSKTGEINPHDSIDLVSLALQLGASFVARGFSGDKDQLVPLIKGGFSHRGFALLDIISPCVTFNNHAESTKSFDYVREHNAVMNRAGLRSAARGDHRVLRGGGDPGRHPPRRRGRAAAQARRGLRPDGPGGPPSTTCRSFRPGARSRPGSSSWMRMRPISTSAWAPRRRRLNRLGETELCPGSAKLDAINARLR